MNASYETAQRLASAIRSRRVSHAFFISARDATESVSFARRAAAVACTDGEDDSRLEFCPDYIELSGAKMKPKDARALIDELARKPIGGGLRTVLIRDAEGMSAECQNILLKTIEEPMGEALFLLCGNIDGVLSTVASRCSVIRLPLRSGADARGHLKSLGADDDDARLYSSAGGGSFELSEALWRDEGLRKARLAALDAVKTLLSGGLPASSVQAMCERGNAQRSAAFMLSFMRDMLLEAANGRAEENVDEASELASLARRFTSGKITCIIGLIAKANEELCAVRGIQFYDAAVMNRLLIEISEAVRTK